jgi:hypothetical protein
MPAAGASAAAAIVVARNPPLIVGNMEFSSTVVTRNLNARSRQKYGEY